MSAIAFLHKVHCCYKEPWVSACGLQLTLSLSQAYTTFVASIKLLKIIPDDNGGQASGVTSSAPQVSNGAIDETTVNQKRKAADQDSEERPRKKVSSLAPPSLDSAPSLKRDRALVELRLEELDLEEQQLAVKRQKLELRRKMLEMD